MRLGMTQQLGLGLEQKLDNLHLALYKSYEIGRLTQHGFHPPLALAAPTRPARPLKELREGWKDIPFEHRNNGHLQLIVQTTLWNLLELYEKDDPPEDFTELLADELDFEIARARELRQEPGYRVFPPVRGRLVRYSTFTADADASAVSSVHATVTVTVDCDFDEVRTVVRDPTKWPERFPLFWGTDKMKERDDGWHGALSLPGKQPIDATLKKQVDDTEDPTETITAFTITHNAWINTGTLSFRMVAEPSRPGWTQISHERSITFSPNLGEAEVPTLSYWTKSDIACLALGG